MLANLLDNLKKSFIKFFCIHVAISYFKIGIFGVKFTIFAMILSVDDERNFHERNFSARYAEVGAEINRVFPNLLNSENKSSVIPLPLEGLMHLFIKRCPDI